MKFPFSMLRDFVDTRLNAEEVGDLLTMAGFELEGIDVVDGESVLDIKVVSNRGDGLSVFGLAREVLAKDAEAQAAERIALDAWRALRCRDGGRVDLRLDAAGVPNFIEANPLAGLNPSYSDLPILCRLNGMPYQELIAAIVESALERVRPGKAAKPLPDAGQAT